MSPSDIGLRVNIEKGGMDNNRITYLYQQYLSKSLSPAELQELRLLFNDPAYQPYFSEIMEQGWNQLREENLLVIPKSVESRVYKEVIAQPQRKVFKVWPEIGGATASMTWKIAAAVAAIVFGIWFYNARYINGGQIGDRHSEFISGSQYDISAGSNKATLTLANGKIINLSEAKTGVVINTTKLTYNDGSTVANLSPSGREGVAREGNNDSNPFSPQGASLPGGERSKMQMLTASTPRGGTYQITLPDGSKVWLNAASAIKFPVSFKGLAKRIVSVNGEAYFQVAKDKKHPFIVKSAGQDIQVLGTHFNINAYHDEDAVKTTLLEGSVKITMLKGGISKVLQIGQQSSVADDQIKVEQVDAEDIVAWKNGKFVFEGETIQSILRKIARWYDVEVVYQEIPVKNNFSGSMGRFETIVQVLRKIEMTNEVHFRIEGRRVVVLK